MEKPKDAPKDPFLKESTKVKPVEQDYEGEDTDRAVSSSKKIKKSDWDDEDDGN